MERCSIQTGTGLRLMGAVRKWLFEVAMTLDIGGMLVHGLLPSLERSCGGGLGRAIRLTVASCETVALSLQWVETPVQTQKEKEKRKQEMAAVGSRVLGLNVLPMTPATILAAVGIHTILALKITGYKDVLCRSTSGPW